MYPKYFEELVEAFRSLPQVGEKAAERFAYAILDMDNDKVQTLSDSLINVKNNIKRCKKCWHICDDEICSICSDASRDHSVICVVNTSKDLVAIEKTGQFNGYYHVLMGDISPSKGTMPEDLTISFLLDRLDSNVKEIIIATNSTLDGETTALYLNKVMQAREVEISRIAYGMPMGGQLDYADELTLTKAIEGRTKL